MSARLAALRLSAALWLAAAGVAAAQSFGGPGAVENQLDDDRRRGTPLIEGDPFEALAAGRARLKLQTGLDISADYSALGVYGDNATGDDSAASGMLRIFGSWQMLGRGTPDTGALVFKGEHRHAFGDLAPSGFGFNAGYAGLIGPPFSDQGLRATNLYWRQRLGGGRATVVGGFLDVTDYVDAFALGSPWLHFSNLVFSTGSGAIGLPNESAFGIAGAALLSDNVYAIAGVADANADPTLPLHSAPRFFNEGDLFKSAEIGWISAPDRLIFDNVHATFWHTDGSARFGVADGWGVAASASWWIGDQWMPFLRGGYADDGGALLEGSISAGLGWQPRPGPGENLLAVGVNWGRPSASAVGPGLNDQWTFEGFYRLRVTERLTLTPDVQVIFNPALNPRDDVVFVTGLRARFAL